jgi:hypothetical protein
MILFSKRKEENIIIPFRATIKECNPIRIIKTICSVTPLKKEVKSKHGSSGLKKDAV